MESDEVMARARPAAADPSAGRGGRSDARLWPALVLSAVLGVGLALLQTRGSYVVEADSTHYLNAARNLAEGNGLVLSQLGPTGKPLRFTTWPPLFPWAVALLVRAGIPAVASAWLISIASFVVVVVLAGLTAAGLAGRAAGVCASLLVAVLPGAGLMANSVMSEGLFSALALAGVAVLALNQTLVAGLAGGVLVAGALLTRYVGAVLPAILGLKMIAEVRARRRSAARLLAALLVAAAAVAWLALHNFSGPSGRAGERSGSDRTLAGNAADLAIGVTRTLAGGSLDALKDRWPRAAALPVAWVVALLAVGAVLLPRRLSWRDGLVQLLGLYGCGYLVLLLALRSSVAFNRLSEARWVVPAVPAFVVLAVAAAARGWEERRVRWWSAAAVATVVVGAAASLAWPPPTGPYGDAGPALEWLRQNYPAGGVVARSAGGRQIAAESTRYSLVPVPVGDQAWSSDAELAAAAKRYGFRHVLLVPRRIDGERRFDREVRLYGTAISAALGGSSGVARVALAEPRLIVIEVGERP